MLSPFGSFLLARLPKIIFGPGVFPQAAAEAAAFGPQTLLVTGARSLTESAHWDRLVQALDRHGLAWKRIMIDGEPSPEMVDQAVAQYGGAHWDSILAIGGGSALDAGKAIAGLLRTGRSVLDHLEGVGPEAPYQGPAVPLVAVPTTAGTGSEATKNAVISRQGRDGFKKSFRDEALVAAVAVVDPDCLISCPKPLLAANAMDAFTQLLESFVSLKAGAFTDALALNGMTAFRDGFFPVWEDDDQAAEGRSRLAYASLLSGICLAQAGLGSVHGLASALGAFFPAPHGVVCGTLLAEATAVNIAALGAREPDNPALAKYARIGALLAGTHMKQPEGLDHLLTTLQAWSRRLALPLLSDFGMTEADLPRVVAASRGSSMKTNPLVLTDEEIAAIMRPRLA